MREINIKKLVEWLGREGAISRLEESDITISEFQEWAESSGIVVDKRTRRSDLIIDLVNRDTARIDKTLEDILEMRENDLKKYLEIRRVSRTELLKLLRKLGIRPTHKDKGNLVEFAAREISDFGMYQRVASGKRR